MWKYKFIMLLSSCLITLVTVELTYRGYVRFMRPMYKPSSHPHMGWELTPGAKRFEDNVEGIRIGYLVNLSGFRDRTNGMWNRWIENDIKIAFIGDSVTYGAGVEFVDTYSNIVELVLSEENISVRSVNFGISGFNALQYLAVLKYKALPLDPDIVILGYFLNDIHRRKTESLPKIFQYALRYYHFGPFLLKRITTFLENRRVQKVRKRAMRATEIAKEETVCSGYAKKCY